MDVDKFLGSIGQVSGDQALARMGQDVGQRAQTIAVQAAKIERLEGFIRMLAEKHPEILPKEEGETNDKGTKRTPGK